MKHRHSGKKKVLGIGLAIIVVALLALYFHQHHKKSANLAVSHSNVPVKGKTSQPTPHQVPTTTSPSAGQSGGIVDKNGQITGSLPPSSQWVSSDSGNITLQQPSANTTIKSGDSLSGLAKVGNVQFILTDSSVGLIAQGNLRVVNGKFSGVLQFTPHSSSGKLEVYYPNPSNGAEEDIIDIDVNFGS